MSTDDNQEALFEYRLEWGPLPARPRDNKSKISPIVEELKKNPGRCARVAKNARSTSSTTPWRKAGCIAHIRQAEEDETRYDVYAWWPAPGETDDETEG